MKEEAKEGEEREVRGGLAHVAGQRSSLYNNSNEWNKRSMKRRYCLVHIIFCTCTLRLL